MVNKKIHKDSAFVVSELVDGSGEQDGSHLDDFETQIFCESVGVLIKKKDRRAHSGRISTLCDFTLSFFSLLEDIEMYLIDCDQSFSSFIFTVSIYHLVTFPKINFLSINYPFYQTIGLNFS